LHNPFEEETYASGYDMGVVLMQGGKTVGTHSKMFHGGILNYPMYHKELHASNKMVKKWKHYMLGMETIIHIDHQPLQYLQAQSKLQQTRHYKWMGFS
jgi:hypothetical protein